MIAALLLALTAHASCAFPEQAVVHKAVEVAPEQIAIVEKHTQCLYGVEPREAKVLWSIALPGLPSDLALQPGTGRLFLFYPHSGELRSLAPGQANETVEATLTPREECTSQIVNGVEVRNCHTVQSHSYRILLGGGVVLLHYGNVLLGAKLDGKFKFRSLTPSFGWFFVDQLALDPLSGRLLVLSNQPSGESIIGWNIVTDRPTLLTPLPEISLWSSDVRQVLFLPGADSFLASTGLTYRSSDFAPGPALGEKFDRAFLTGGSVVTIRAEGEPAELFKATVYSPSLRPVSTEYFFQVPQLVAGAGKNTFTFVLPQGSLREIFEIRTLRSEP